MTAAACRLSGGQWHGGHDISGHVFLMVLGSAVLLMETVPVVFPSTGAGRADGSAGPVARTAARGADSEKEGASGGAVSALWSPGVVAVLGVVALHWWMLLMTAIFFHTWFEKVS